MSHLDILLPFGLPPAELSADLLRDLNAPALATLTARARPGTNESRHEAVDVFHRALPHERWLMRRFGLENTENSNSSPAIAPALMQAFGLAPRDGVWFVLQPVHIHVARDHLVLTDPRQLDLSEQEAKTLFSIAQALFDENGKELVYGNAATWFVRADDWAALETATPDAASGHNIDIWMPKGPGERDWRKVQNEVQMHWFNHPVNEEREAARRKTVNSLWLWGGAAASGNPTCNQYSAAFNFHCWMRALAQLVPQRSTVDTAKDLLASLSGHGILVLDALLEPALTNDWGRWLECMRRLEADWFAPILDGLKSARIDQVSLILTHDSRASSFTATRSSLRKFWVKPTLATLCP